MAKQQMTKDEREILKEEKDSAEAFLCARLKPKGQLTQISDGKDQFFVKLTLKDLKTLLYLHAIERITARAPQIQQAVHERMAGG